MEKQNKEHNIKIMDTWRKIKIFFNFNIFIDECYHVNDPTMFKDPKFINNPNILYDLLDDPKYFTLIRNMVDPSISVSALTRINFKDKYKDVFNPTKPVIEIYINSEDDEDIEQLRFNFKT